MYESYNQLIDFTKRVEEERKSLFDQIRKINPCIVHGYEKIDSFKEQLFDLLVSKTYNQSFPMVVSTDSRSLFYLDSAEQSKPLIVSPTKVHSMFRYHGVNYALVGDVISHLSDSAFAFGSVQKESRDVVMLNRTDKYNDRMIAIVDRESSATFVDVNCLVTLYGKRDFQEFMNRSYEADRPFYLKENAEQILASQGLQLPIGLSSALAQSDYSMDPSGKQEDFDETEWDEWDEDDLFDPGTGIVFYEDEIPPAEVPAYNQVPGQMKSLVKTGPVPHKPG